MVYDFPSASDSAFESSVLILAGSPLLALEDSGFVDFGVAPRTSFRQLGAFEDGSLIDVDEIYAPIEESMDILLGALRATPVEANIAAERFLDAIQTNQTFEFLTWLIATGRLPTPEIALVDLNPLVDEHVDGIKLGSRVSWYLPRLYFQDESLRRLRPAATPFAYYLATDDYGRAETLLAAGRSLLPVVRRFDADLLDRLREAYQPKADGFLKVQATIQVVNTGSLPISLSSRATIEMRSLVDGSEQAQAFTASLEPVPAGEIDSQDDNNGESAAVSVGFSAIILPPGEAMRLLVRPDEPLGIRHGDWAAVRQASGLQVLVTLSQHHSHLLRSSVVRALPTLFPPL